MRHLIGLDLSCLEREPETGVERYARRLVEHLPLVAEDLSIVALVRSGRPVPSVPAPGCVEIADSILPRPLWRETRLPAVIAKLKIALLHAPVAALPMRLSIPRVATIHDVDPPMGRPAPGWFSKSHLRLFHALAAAPRTIVPPSPPRRALLAKDPSAEERIRVIPHGVDRDFKPDGLPLKRDRYRLQPRTPYLLWVGTVRERKDPLVLVRAFAELAARPEFEDLHLLMCGELQMDEAVLRAPLYQADINRRFLLHGYAAREDLPDLYREAEAVIIPSRLEGFGLPALEAMACGTPLLVSRDPALVEVVGGGAMTFPIGDHEALAADLARILPPSEQRENLRRQARDRAAQYSWTASALAHAEVYREALQAPH